MSYDPRERARRAWENWTDDDVRDELAPWPTTHPGEPMDPLLHRWEALALPHREDVALVVDYSRAAAGSPLTAAEIASLLDVALIRLEAGEATVERLRAKLSRIRALVSDAFNAANWIEGEGFPELHASLTAILVEAAP